MKLIQLAVIVGTLILSSGIAIAQDAAGIDPEALIERILATEQIQRDNLKDVTYSAEYVEQEEDGDEGYREKVRFVKDVYIKYFPDTTWFAEKYLEYYDKGELQSEKKMREEAAERTKKRIKRKAHDVSYPMIRPFYPERRSLYNIEYTGVAEERIDDWVCHHFRVTAKESSDSLINGDYYFEAETFHLVLVDFSPSKLVKKLMFKLNELNMSVHFAANADGYWLPRRFDVQGKGKAALFIGVKFAGTEYYRNPVVNSGLDDSIFEVTHE
jgi:hypothetical protein